jgi:ureidoacrylate peracid hydrolase
MCQRLGVGRAITAPDGRSSRIHVENTWNTEILPELAPLAGDMVITKRRFSAFYDTELDSQLRRMGAKYLIVTGCTTSVCIESTIRDAAFRDYVCLLPVDCTGQPGRHDSNYSGHEASLKIIVIYSDGYARQRKFGTLWMAVLALECGSPETETALGGGWV